MPATEATYVTLSESILLSIVGFGVVFLALGLLAVFITIMAKIVSNINAKNTPQKSEEKAAAPAPAAPAKDPNKVPLPETTSQGQCDLHNVSYRDAALIMAIVADKLDAPLNTLVFKSIKEVK